LYFGFVVGIAGELGLDFHRVSEPTSQDGQDEDGDHDDHEGDR
jgi:hypothetical protein